jgi:flagellar basal body-associated protein FliL
MLATIAILAQRGTHEPPDDGIGIGLILLGVAIALLVALAIITLFRMYSKKTRETGPDATPHKQGHVGSGGGA